ncbi:rolling circle replication-associated protein [Burkholderia sp. F1]|uniref:rolling circle replication-associated protein n=1 Tax=Burkholderia sp. F1 TaxID=3366817 RepID=UPI003D705052
MHDASIGDYSPFRREWVIRGRNFGDGQVEVTATRFDRYMGALSLNAKPKAKRGESENSESNLMDSAKRAKQQVRLRCKAIGADRMITLTYRENMTDKARLKRDFDKLRRRLGGLYDFQYVAVAERQKRGAWHLHVAVRGRQNYRVLRSIWQSIVGVGNGQINVRNPFKEKGLRHKLAGYLAKYITKDFAEHAMNEKRYWTSRGVVVPEVMPIDHITSNDPAEALKLAFKAALQAGATLDRCQAYWRQELGVFWLSTRETA